MSEVLGQAESLAAMAPIVRRTVREIGGATAIGAVTAGRRGHGWRAAVGKNRALLAMALSIAAILALSLAYLDRQRADLLSQFASEQQQRLTDVSRVLGDRLAAIEKDARLAATIARGARIGRDDDQASQDREIASVFRGLVAIVEPYRTLGLFTKDRGPAVVAIDPTEKSAATVAQLVEASAALARRMLGGDAPTPTGVVSIGARSLLLYGRRAGDSEVVVMSIDGPMLLSDVLRPLPGKARFLVEDTTGGVWTDCEDRVTCRRRNVGDGIWQAVFEQPRDATPRRLPAAALPDGRADAIAFVRDVPLANGGPYRVALVTSTGELDRRQGRATWQLLLTSLGAVAAALTFGRFIVRQRTRATELQTRLQSAQELAELRERSDLIMENVPVGIIGVTATGAGVFANRFVTGRAPGTPRTDGPGLSAPLARWLTGLSGDVRRSVETRAPVVLSPTDAHARFPVAEAVDVRIIPLDRGIGDVEALVLVEDLSALKALEQRLLRAEKLVTASVLSAGLAHDLGTPLMVIRGRAEHLLDTATPEAAKDLTAVIEQIDSIAATMKQVLDFTRSRPVETTATDAVTVADKAIALLEWRLSAKRVQVALDVAPGVRPPPVAADAHQLEQVFINLLLNALDASSENGRITIGFQRHDPQARTLRLSVRDRGEGIVPENLAAVFDPYFTTKKPGEGAGLGLSIVAQIVRNHGGTIKLTSELGTGTTVAIDWPLAEEQT